MSDKIDRQYAVLVEAAQVASWESEGHDERCALHQEDLPRIAQALALDQALDGRDSDARKSLEQCPLCREVLSQTASLLREAEPERASPVSSPCAVASPSIEAAEAATPEPAATDEPPALRRARVHLWLAALAALLLAGAVGVLLVHRDRSESKRPRSAQVDTVMQPPRDGGSRPRTRPPVVASRLPKDADALYRAQQYTGAIRLLKRSGRRYQESVSHLEGLRKALQAGLALASRDGGQAVAKLKRALAHDVWLGGAHQGWIQGRIGRTYKEHAAMLLKRGKYVQCYRMLALAEHHKAAGLAPLRQALADRARELFGQGYVLRMVNPAQSRIYWRRVRRMVPPSSEWAKKATLFLARFPPQTVAGGTQDTPTTGKPGSRSRPAEPPLVSAPRSSAAELYGRARQAWLSGQCAKAIQLARQANRQKYATRNVSLIGFCGCALRRRATARWAYKLLRGGSRNMLIAVCRSKGIQLP